MKNFIKSIVILVFLGIVACEPNDTVAPIPPSDGDLIEPNVGGPDQPNQVFIDLSTATTTEVVKTSWDLAFSTGAEFRVALNYASFMSARPTDNNDLAMISSNLVTEEYKAEMYTGPDCIVSWVDDPSGDLSKTAIDAVSASDAENLVFVLYRGYYKSGDQSIDRGFKKIKITLEGQNYVITYGDIDDTSFKTQTITKDANYNFIFFSFDNGIVSVEPEKSKWDIAMTTATLHTAADNGLMVPYNFPDISITNQANMKIAAVETGTDISYENFTLVDANGLQLQQNRLGIGSSWRAFDFASFMYNVKDNIFYVIEDADGNLYKLAFTRMLCLEVACAGDRGYPEFTYELLK